ncbi:MAG TPA: carbohydrate ABC transporter permease [Bauldia sp.]|nr:carbohydrate ABC transporter permease [Bauldia sp.]
MTTATAAAVTRSARALDPRLSGARYTRGPGRWIVLALLLALLAVFFFPFVLAIANAIKTPADYASHGPLGVPHSFSLRALADFWTNVDFTRKLTNSILLSGLVAIFGVFLSLLNAYAIGIGKVRGGRPILVLLLLSIMIPQEALVYPIYFMSKAAGLFDSLASCIIVFSVLQSAFGTYLLASVLSTFPREIIEAARVDGANSWQILWLVIVPILRPTLAVLATFFFIWTWNEFLLPLVLLISNDTQTVTVAMGVLHGQYVSDPTAIAAAALLGMMPTVLFFLVFQRTLTRGVIVGAVK